ncbi:MAG: 4Fe-4S dicluster domain-containing protein [Desulfobacterales bacterium]
MGKSFLIDTTLCTACRGCQVACKQWHNLPAEETVNRGSYQNPQDLSFETYKLVRMNETVIDDRFRWLFFPDQCRHCLEPPCEATAGEPTAIYRDPDTGAVVYTPVTKELNNTDEVIESCPYNIPRKAPDGALTKCDMCLDRVQAGLAPACVKTCPTGAMNFGEREAMLALAKSRLAVVKKKYPQAALLDPEDIRVIFLVAHEPQLYYKFAVAATGTYDMTRQVALQRMLKPFSGLVARLM